jgi:hypothetical protein
VTRITGQLKFLAAGVYFVVLDLPDRGAVVKFLRSEGPSGMGRKGWRRWLPAALSRRKRTAKAADAFRAFRALAQSTTFTLSDCFPETEIVDEVDVTFEWEGRMCGYRGPAYVQHKVEMFGNDTPLDAFDWEAIPEAQHRLWRVGVGLGSGAETWGPKNWCRTNRGEIRLADLSSLTQDRERVLNCLREATRETRRRMLSERQPPRCREQVDLYLAFVAERLGREPLDRLWRSGC